MKIFETSDGLVILELQDQTVASFLAIVILATRPTFVTFPFYSYYFFFSLGLLQFYPLRLCFEGLYLR